MKGGKKKHISNFPWSTLTAAFRPFNLIDVRLSKHLNCGGFKKKVWLINFFLFKNVLIHSRNSEVICTYSFFLYSSKSKARRHVFTQDLKAPPAAAATLSCSHPGSSLFMVWIIAPSSSAGSCWWTHSMWPQLWKQQRDLPSRFGHIWLRLSGWDGGGGGAFRGWWWHSEGIWGLAPQVPAALCHLRLGSPLYCMAPASCLPTVGLILPPAAAPAVPSGHTGVAVWRFCCTFCSIWHLNRRV